MKIIRGLCRFFVWLCMIFICAMMLLIVAEVLRRAIFNKAILGSTEWAQVLLCCTLSAFGAAVLTNRMTKVDILTSRMKPKTQVLLDILMLLLSAASIGALAWAQGAYALKVYQQHVVYNNIRLPQWPFVAVFAMSYAVAAIATFGVMIRKIVSAAKGEWDKEVRLGDADPVFAFGKHGMSSWTPDNVTPAQEKEGGVEP